MEESLNVKTDSNHSSVSKLKEVQIRVTPLKCPRPTDKYCVDVSQLSSKECKDKGIYISETDSSSTTSQLNDVPETERGNESTGKKPNENKPKKQKKKRKTKNAMIDLTKDNLWHTSNMNYQHYSRENALLKNLLTRPRTVPGILKRAQKQKPVELAPTSPAADTQGDVNPPEPVTPSELHVLQFVTSPYLPDGAVSYGMINDQHLILREVVQSAVDPDFSNGSSVIIDAGGFPIMGSMPIATTPVMTLNPVVSTHAHFSEMAQQILSVNGGDGTSLVAPQTSSESSMTVLPPLIVVPGSTALLDGGNQSTFNASAVANNTSGPIIVDGSVVSRAPQTNVARKPSRPNVVHVPGIKTTPLHRPLSKPLASGTLTLGAKDASTGAKSLAQKDAPAVRKTSNTLRQIAPKQGPYGMFVVDAGLQPRRPMRKKKKVLHSLSAMGTMLVKDRENLALQYHQRVLDENKVWRVARKVTLPLREVHLFDVGCQTDVMSLVEPGRMIEINIQERTEEEAGLLDPGALKLVGEAAACIEVPSSATNPRGYVKGYRSVLGESGTVRITPTVASIEKMFASATRKGPTATSREKMLIKNKAVVDNMIAAERLRGGEGNTKENGPGRNIAHPLDDPPSSGEPLDKMARLDHGDRGLEPPAPTPMDVDDETDNGTCVPQLPAATLLRNVNNLVTNATRGSNTTNHILNATQGSNTTNHNLTARNVNATTARNVNATPGSNATDRNANATRPRNVNLETLDYPTKLQAYNDWLSCIRRYPVTGNMPIHQAVLDNNTVALRRQCFLLTARKMSLDVKNFSRQSALHLAVSLGATKAVSVLRAMGARPEDTDANGNNSVHLAICSISTDSLRALAQTGPDLPLNRFNDSGFTPLHLCCALNKPKHAKLLLEMKAEVDLRDLHSGRSPLFLAVELNRAQVLELLLSAGAHPLLANYAGHTPAHVLGEGPRRDTLVRRLLEESVLRATVPGLRAKRAPLSQGGNARLMTDENAPERSPQEETGSEIRSPVTALAAGSPETESRKDVRTPNPKVYSPATRHDARLPLTGTDKAMRPPVSEIDTLAMSRTADSPGRGSRLIRGVTVLPETGTAKSIRLPVDSIPSLTIRRSTESPETGSSEKANRPPVPRIPSTVIRRSTESPETKGDYKVVNVTLLGQSGHESARLVSPSIALLRKGDPEPKPCAGTEPKPELCAVARQRKAGRAEDFIVVRKDKGDPKTYVLKRKPS